MGDVPNGWTVTPLKYIGSAIIGLTYSPEDIVDEGYGTLVLRSSNIQDGRITLDDNVFVKADIPIRLITRLGDILICSRNGSRSLIGKNGIIDSTSEGLSFGAFTTVFRTNHHKFLYYVLNSSLFKFQAGRFLTTTINQLTTETLNSFEIPLPPCNEQEAITAHLDRETIRIDGLVAKKTRFIELLREKRQALITHAVTKGLDPNVKMKDSGVEWLGKVPEHWEVRKISSVSTKITNGFVGPTRDILVEDGVRYLQSLHIKGNQIKFEVPYFVTETWSKDHQKSILRTGDVLIVQTGDIGQVTVVTDEFAGCNCHALIIIAPQCSIVSGKWLSWVLNSGFGFHSLLSIQTGAMHPHLNCGNVKDLFLPVPPLNEQEPIIQFIENEEVRMKLLISKTELSIALLKERRSALITAAVTGQIDLREVA